MRVGLSVHGGVDRAAASRNRPSYGVGGQNSAHRDRVDDLAAQHHPHRLVEREPPHDQVGFLVVGVRPADVGQAGGEIDPHALVAETRRGDEVDEDAPVCGGQSRLFLRVRGPRSCAAARRRRPAARRAAPTAACPAGGGTGRPARRWRHRRSPGRRRRRSARRLRAGRCRRRASAPRRRVTRKSFRRRWFRSRRSRNRVQPRTADFSRSLLEQLPVSSGCSAPFARCSGISTGSRSAAL